MPEFIPGRELSRRFYWEVVRPLLDRHYPNLPHAAALLGPGSEVLGFDTPMSMDHDWYPNVLIFLRDQDADLKEPLKEMFRQHLPHSFLGFGVDSAPSELEENTRVMVNAAEGPVAHNVFPVTVRSFARLWLDWDIDQPLDAIDWLTIPSQTLRTMTAGAVHHDGVGELTEFRQQLSWYPYDVWLYLLASGWSRIAEEEHLMPRAGYAGDELGSALMGSRLVRDVMSLCFLMEKQYAPYPKWFGTAFRQLNCAQDLAPILWRAQQSGSWQEREAALGEANLYLARWHNRLGITSPLPEELSSFFGRPFQVIWGGKFAEAICARMTDPEVKRLAEKALIGSIDQFSDNTNLRSNIVWRKNLRRLYEFDIGGQTK
jgi:hypothetical protein